MIIIDNICISTSNSYGKAPTPSVAEFGGAVSKKVIKVK